MEKLFLGDRNAGPNVGRLGVLVLGVSTQMVIHRGFCVGQRVHHSKQSWVGILQEREKTILLF